MAEGSTIGGLDQVLNMHRDPGIPSSDHPSTSLRGEFITFEEIRQVHVPASKRTRGRPKIDYSIKPKNSGARDPNQRRESGEKTRSTR